MEESTDFGCEALSALHISLQQTRCEFEFSFDLCLRTKRNRQMIEEYLSRAPVVSLGDVGRYRDRCASNLLGKPEPLVTWQACCDGIALLGQLHRSLPYQEISIRANLWLSHIDL